MALPMIAKQRLQANQALALGRRLATVQLIVGGVLAVALLVMLITVAPTLFGAESFPVRSASMEPALHVGALAVVVPAHVSDLSPGDIITYRTPTQPDLVVTHRLVAVETDDSGRQRFRTKGDSNSTEDLVLVDPNAVLGKVLYSVPYAGYSVEFVQQTSGKLLLVVLPALLLLLDFLRQRAGWQADAAEAEAVLAGGAASPGGRTGGTRGRVQLLLQKGNAALDGGYLELAERAADGVLTLDPRSEDGWLLKAESQAETRNRLVLLQTALALNPGAPRIADRIAALSRSGGTLSESSTGPLRQASVSESSPQAGQQRAAASLDPVGLPGTTSKTAGEDTSRHGR